jgi:alpha-1,2-mannosyltransferase
MRGATTCTAQPRASQAYVRSFAIVAAVIPIGVFGLYCATHSVDFPVYHRAARQIIAGSYDIYPKPTVPGGPLPAHGFRYAPAIAWMFVPFGLLPLAAAAFAFYLVQVGAIVYIISAGRRYVGPNDRWPRLAVAAGVATAGYVLEALRYGNAHLVCVALMVFAFVAAESGRPARSGVALGVAIATKITPLLLLAYLGWRRRYAACLYSIAALAALAALPIAAVGVDRNKTLAAGFVTYAVEKIGEGDNYSLFGVLTRTSMSARTVDLVWSIAVVVGGLIVACILRRRPLSPAAAALELSVVLAATLLASPHTQRRYFAALLFPLVVVLATRARTTRAGQLPGYSALIATAAVATVLPVLCAGRGLALVYESWSPYFWGTLLTFIVLVAETVRVKAIPVTDA